MTGVGPKVVVADMVGLISVLCLSHVLGLLDSLHWVCMSQSLMELRASQWGTLCPCGESIERLWGLHWATELRGQNWDGPEVRGFLADY